MDIKIKHDRITALLGDYYDPVYSKLKGLPDNLGSIFAQRNVWDNSVQWHLPDGRWYRLADADPMAASKIYAVLESRKKLLQNKLAAHFNSDTLNNILTVPDDRFVYYNEDAGSGQLNIKLVAWGYSSYKENSSEQPHKNVRNVIIRFINSNAPVGVLRFFVVSKQGIKTSFETGDDGCYKFNNLPEDTNFTVEYDGKKYFVLPSNVSEYFDIDITPVLSKVDEEEQQPPIKKEPEKPKKELEKTPPEKTVEETESNGDGFNAALWVTILLLALLVGGAFYAGWQLLFDSPFN